jgi:trehalose synthase
MIRIEEYASIVGQPTIDELFLLARNLEGKVVQNINSTAVGGGVAEILSRIVPLLKQLGVDAHWDVIKGDERFFATTKKMHNGLHGTPVTLTKEELDAFIEINRTNAEELSFSDIVFVHDPQPIALVEKRDEGKNHWIWRCHIDFSNPDEGVWQFLEGYINRYDVSVFAAPAFARTLEGKQVLISPSIDPLSDKNRELPDNVVENIFKRFGIDRSRPIITQISRFDYLKDPLGVIQAYQMAKKNVDVQLVLAGGGATDDPEGPLVMQQVQEAAAKDEDIHVLFLPPASDIEINALQRGSTVVLQKSLKEGFGLTVSEALWKGRPVIASAVGGIPLQISNKYSGILTRSVQGTGHAIKQLINEPEYARRLGINGKEHIKNNYLITRHIKDYLLLFVSLFKNGRDIVYL